MRSSRGCVFFVLKKELNTLKQRKTKSRKVCLPRLKRVRRKKTKESKDSLKKPKASNSSFEAKPRKLRYAETANLVGVVKDTPPAVDPLRGPLPPADHKWWDGKQSNKQKLVKQGVICRLKDFGLLLGGSLVEMPIGPYSAGFHRYQVERPLASIFDKSRSALQIKNVPPKLGGAYHLGNTACALRYLRTAHNVYLIVRRSLFEAMEGKTVLSGLALREISKALRRLRPDLPGVNWYNQLYFCYRRLSRGKHNIKTVNDRRDIFGLSPMTKQNRTLRGRSVLSSFGTWSGLH